MSVAVKVRVGLLVFSKAAAEPSALVAWTTTSSSGLSNFRTELSH
jgi:hypothetical protein